MERSEIRGNATGGSSGPGLRFASSGLRFSGATAELQALQPRIPGLDRIVAAVELTQIGQPAHREAMGILFAGLEQRGDIFGHLGARFTARGGGAVGEQIIGLHNAVDGGLHGLFLHFQACSSASNLAIARLASLSLLNSPRRNICTMISSRRSLV